MKKINLLCCAPRYLCRSRGSCERRPDHEGAHQRTIGWETICWRGWVPFRWVAERRTATTKGHHPLVVIDVVEVRQTADILYRLAEEVGVLADRLNRLRRIEAAARKVAEPRIWDGERYRDYYGRPSDESIRELREALGGWRASCPDCGDGVRIDEDGCCATCGADTESVRAGK